MEADKLEAIKTAMAQIEKQFGKGSIMRMGDTGNRMSVETVSSGSIAVDIALGGGMPRGRVVEIFGPEGSGKTTLALHTIAEIQKTGGTAAFVDAEHALDPIRSQALGVNITDMLVSQPDTGEQALEIVETLVRSGAVDIVVIDSVAALVPRAEIEGEMGDAFVGIQARLMSQALRKLTGVISKSKTTVIFINQLREKIGIMFGNPETTPGGRALKFYSSVRIDVRKVDNIKDGERVIGSRVRVKIVKNKIAPPFRVAEVDMMFDKGISKMGSLLDVALETGILQKAGSWFSYGEAKISQGREGAKAYLEENLAVAAEIEKKIKDNLSQSAAPVAVGVDDPLAEDEAQV